MFFKYLLCDSAVCHDVYLHQWDASSHTVVFCLVSVDNTNGVTHVLVVPKDEKKIENKYCMCMCICLFVFNHVSLE